MVSHYLWRYPVVQYTNTAIILIIDNGDLILITINAKVDCFSHYNKIILIFQLVSIDCVSYYHMTSLLGVNNAMQ